MPLAFKIFFFVPAPFGYVSTQLLLPCLCLLPQPPALAVSLTPITLCLFPSWSISFSTDLDNSSRLFQNEMFLMAPPCPPATGRLLCSTSWGNYLKIVSAGCSWFLPLVGPQSHFHSHYSTEQNYLVGWISHQFGI